MWSIRPSTYTHICPISHHDKLSSVDGFQVNLSLIIFHSFMVIPYIPHMREFVLYIFLFLNEFTQHDTLKSVHATAIHMILVLLTTKWYWIVYKCDSFFFYLIISCCTLCWFQILAIVNGASDKTGAFSGILISQGPLTGLRTGVGSKTT